MERLLFEGCRWETRLGRLSNELQKSTIEDLGHISYENNNLKRVRGKIRYYLFTSSNFFLLTLISEEILQIY